jgi:PAS domain S-box-containing protein
LRESEGRFRTIFENAGAGITLVDKQGHPIKCNAMFEKMLGYTEEELRSMVFTEFTHPDDIQADWTLYRELVDGQRDRYELEKRYIKKDGRVMWGQLIVSRVKGKDGAFADYHVGMVEDITERKRAEQALQRSESYLAEAQRLTHTGSWAFNPATAKNNYWSEEMFRIFAVDSQRGLPTSETFWNRVHPEDRDSVYKMFENAAREKTEYEHDHRIVLPDGTVKHIHAIGHPVFNTAGEIVEFVGTSIDVTERKRAEQERERLQQLQAELARMNRVTTMGELTASLAHEINQPIAAAVTNASTSLRWLAIDPPNLEEAREAAKRSVKDANRAAEIIGRIRQLFRKGTAERELLDINEVIREMIVLLLNEAHRYSISLRTDLDTDLPSIVADRVQLQQVLMNLMLNGIDAVKDADGERELTIKSGRQNRDLLISVTDTGKGLPANEEEKIFDAFFTTKTDGTGMGLSISRSIIESHGGRLWAMNNTLHGATFYFTLPTNVEAQDDDARWRSYGVHY